MKKTIFCAFCILFFTGLHSQERPDNVFTALPAFGLSGCQIHGDGYSGYDKLGLFAGGAVEAKLSERFGLQLGFYFSQKGARRNPNPKNGDYDSFRLRLNYLDMMLNLRYVLNSKYFLTLGPSLGYLVSFDVRFNSQDLRDQYQFRNTEIGLNFGLGRVLNEKFSIEVRSSNSIVTILPYGVPSNVFYTNFVARHFNKGLYNNILTLLVAYKIGGKKHEQEH